MHNPPFPLIFLPLSSPFWGICAFLHRMEPMHFSCVKSTFAAGRGLAHTACQMALFLHAVHVTHRWTVQDVSHAKKKTKKVVVVNGGKAEWISDLEGLQG